MSGVLGEPEARLIPEIVAQILARRGLAPEAMGDFLYPNYDEHLHDPLLMTDMDKAVARIVVAAKKRERVVIYGDYDIDGITASAIMIEGLRHLGIDATSYIPDRFEEGYGINAEALEFLAQEGADLVISVDCGITSVQEAAWAREHGLDLIITDHHSVPEVIPEAIAVINPKRPGDAYPFKDLCGAGVAFKVIQALAATTGKPEAGQEKWLLDLVALGTVCDIVELVGENRVLASYGLRVMRRTRRAGLRALANVGGVDIARVEAYHLGFVLGPRMNAAGRLEHAARSVELVMTDDGARALAIAEELDELNRQRRASQDTVFKAADRQAEKYAEDPVLVVAGSDWSHGIVGIVASKLVEKWHKPVLVAQKMGDYTKGSARSLGTFNMVEALRANSELFVKFGGHFYAAGYTLATKDLGKLRTGLCRYHEETKATAVVPVLEADTSLDTLAPMTWDLYNDLQLLEPHGAANPQPVIELPGLTIIKLATMGQDKTHLRLTLSDGRGRLVNGVGFGLAVKYPDLKQGQIVTIFGHLNKNEFRGETSLQLMLAEIR